jgi:CPA1 family monovalent cation:H+ antiporter
MGKNLSAFDIAAIVIVLVAALSWLNHKFLRLQPTIGLVIMGALASAVVVGIDWIAPAADLTGILDAFLARIDFRHTLLNGMLSFLLFAGALNIDLGQVLRCRWPIAVLSTVGVLVSTVIVGFGLQLILSLAGHPAPLVWCLVFGALISPTDPVAVLAIIKGAGIPANIEATVAGESLFNDGVGVVVFTILLAAAAGGGQLSAVEGLRMFGVEALGGAALGVALGLLAAAAMRSIEDANVEVMLSLALVMGGYALANAIGVSGPIGMATAGLMLGNQGSSVMGETVRDYMVKFWTLIDELLNAVLFLLVGLESAALLRNGGYALLGLAVIPLALAGRLVSVGAPLALWRRTLPYGEALPILTWGGLRGGLSVAMALSLPPGDIRDLFLAITYVVVLFSVVAQGSTIGLLVRRLTVRPPAAPAPAEA